jgi:hypothetical protein
MLELPLLILSLVFAILWFALRKHEKIGGFVALAAPVGIAICLIAGTGILRSNSPGSNSEPVLPTSASAPGAAPAIPTGPLPSTALVRPQGEVNMRTCPGANCPVVGQLRRSSRLSLSGKSQAVESSSGALLTWVEVKTNGGEYCLQENILEKDGCQKWQTAPEANGWVNMTFLRSE